MKFKNKTIFIISHEKWGKMMMSKHHYAVGLGELGNDVFFINLPDNRRELKRGQIVISATEYKNVSAVSHRLYHPYFFRDQYNRLYNLLTSFHLRRIIRKVGVYPDVVWSFDAENALPLKCFPKSDLRIYHPVDGPFGHDHEVRAADGADVILSVTSEILKTYEGLGKPMHRVNHGVADVFFSEGALPKQNKSIRIGYSGCLVRNDLDIPIFLKIINDHPDKTFEFWGENDFTKSSIHLPQDVILATQSFVETLHGLPNVIMHGSVNSVELAAGLREMDALLICYNTANDQNHHKVLEYLATGKVIMSNHLSSYSNAEPGLIEMMDSKTSNEDMPRLFTEITSNLKKWNSTELQQLRIKYARQNSYSSNIREIEAWIEESLDADS
jgi:hypothetical protein